MADGQKLRELAFKADVPPEEIPAFVEGMNAILRMPVETLLQMLCTVNHFLNGGETLQLSDLAIYEEEQAMMKAGVEQRRTSKYYGEEEQPQQAHNTLAIEEALMDIVRRGTPSRSNAGLPPLPPSKAAPSRATSSGRYANSSSSRRR